MIFVKPVHHKAEAAPPYPDNAQVDIVRTTTSNQVVSLPLIANNHPNILVNFGDGSPEVTITSTLDPNVNHTYATPGDYTRTMTGSFSRIEYGGVNGIADPADVIEILHWSNDQVLMLRCCAFCPNLVASGPGLILRNDCRQFFQEADSLTILSPFDGLSGNMTRADNFIQGCSSLLDFPASPMSASAQQGFQEMARDSSIINWPPGIFDTNPSINFTRAFRDTFSLTSQSLDNILVSIDAANTSNGDFEATRGQPPGAAGLAAKSAMESRGWTVVVPT